MRAALAKTLLVGVSILVALILAEQGLRILGYEYLPVSVEVGKTEDARLYHLFGSDEFVYDPDLIWRPREGAGVFNAEGFRGPLMGVERPPARLRIVAVGDSNTLGWAGPNGSNWPASFAGALGARGISADVVNAGVWGYSSLQGVGRVRQVMAFRPDIVFISFGSNDAVRVAIPDRRFAGKSARRRALERWFNDFRVGQLTTAVANAVRRGGTGLGPRVGLSEYRRNLREMARLASESGARAVFLTRPFELEIPNEEWWKNWGHEYNRATAEVAVDVGAPLVDLYTHFKGRREYFADESHFTGEGHERAARILVEELAPVILEEARRTGALTASSGRIGARRLRG